MPHARYSSDEIVRRGQELYEQKIRAAVEEVHRGKHLVVDIETGEYEIGDDHYAIARRMQGERQNRPLYALRIGYSALGRMGGRFRVRSC